MKKIFLATKNKGKIKEMKEILSGFKNIEIVSFLDGIETPEIVEDGTTFEENSQKKALGIAKFLNMYTVADDSGISVETLGGAPGIYSARYAGENATSEENLNKLFEVMKKEENKKAKYVAVITIASPELEYKSFRGELEGEILDQKRGTNGFGYDPIFYLKDYDKTTAEISAKEKNAISHRGKALQQLKSHIEDFIKKGEKYMKIKLIKPSLEMKNEYYDYIRELEEAKEEIVPYSVTLLEDSYEKWLKKLDDFEKKETCPIDFVPASTYFLINDKKKLIGAVNIRHYLNEYLLKRGGHIGYGVRPSERGKGYASQMLALTLEIMKNLGIKKALITCDSKNIGSAKTILKNGGILENEVKEGDNLIQRYWITIK